MNFLLKTLNYAWLHLWKYKAVERSHARYVTHMHERRPVNVVFMAIDVSMWRYQYLYELMEQDSRFCVTIVLTPCMGREQEKDLSGLRAYFEKKNIKYIDYKIGQKPYDIRKELDPDIIFYTQPYENLLVPEYDCRHFYDKLICYLPYGFNTFAKWSYNLHFCNQAWRLYYPNEMMLSAVKLASNKGRNVRVAGYANADGYLSDTHIDVWHKDDDGILRKRVIWAPHFTIKYIAGTIPPRSNFLWMAELMVHIAHEYSDKIQFVFKPHPALISHLYNEEGWGKERTDEYYHLWASMSNTQLEIGEYVDLFMTSDAMIHDCGSFTVEYLYSQNPVLFMSRDMDSIRKPLSDFGKKAYDASYIGASEQDIRHFIDDVVLGGNDPMKAQREHLYKNYLQPPNGKSVAQNVVDDIVKSLNL